MKKMMFLMLTLLIWGAANVNAQVTIGSEKEPHAGAILDLQSTDKGLLLPQVPISTGYDFQLPGDAKAAEGMMIYNNGNLPGLYVWNGQQWNTVQTCALPLAPAAITYNLDVTKPVATNALLKISAGVVVGATSYSWILPNNLEEQGIASERTITVRVKGEGEIDLSKLSVRAVNACGKGPALSGSGILAAALIKPATPTFTISRTTVDPNSLVTLTCGDVGATEYAWTFPEGFVGTSPTMTNMIQLRTPAVESPVEYTANQFSVVATNEVGSSASITATGDGILVGICKSAPVITNIETPKGKSVRYVGYQMNATVDVNTSGTTLYEWIFPKGVSVTSPTSSERSISLRFDEPGRFPEGSFKCIVTNGCGIATMDVPNELLILAQGDYGSDGENVTVGDNIYQTWIGPERAGVGTWMVGFSKEGSPQYLGVPGHELEYPWGYYTQEEALTACPAPWRIPTTTELWYLAALSNGDTNRYVYTLLWAAGYGYRLTNAGTPSTGNAYVRGDGSDYIGAAGEIRNVAWIRSGSMDMATQSELSRYLVKCILDRK